MIYTSSLRAFNVTSAAPFPLSALFIYLAQCHSIYSGLYPVSTHCLSLRPHTSFTYSWVCTAEARTFPPRSKKMMPGFSLHRNRKMQTMGWISSAVVCFGLLHEWQLPLRLVRLLEYPLERLYRWGLPWWRCFSQKALVSPCLNKGLLLSHTLQTTDMFNCDFWPVFSSVFHTTYCIYSTDQDINQVSPLIFHAWWRSNRYCWITPECNIFSRCNPSDTKMSLIG